LGYIGSVTFGILGADSANRFCPGRFGDDAFAGLRLDLELAFAAIELFLVLLADGSRCGSVCWNAGA
jgi:hypothetical protein